MKIVLKQRRKIALRMIPNTIESIGKLVTEINDHAKKFPNGHRILLKSFLNLHMFYIHALLKSMQ